MRITRFFISIFIRIFSLLVIISIFRIIDKGKTRYVHEALQILSRFCEFRLDFVVKRKIYFVLEAIASVCRVVNRHRNFIMYND